MYFTLASTKKFFSTPVKGRITIYPVVSSELQVTTSDVRQKETYNCNIKKTYFTLASHQENPTLI